MSSGADMISACCCFPVQGTKLSGIVECERHEKRVNGSREVGEVRDSY